MTITSLPVVAIVGRPNVGKSTLFNRLTATRNALVADIPGLTRDRQYGFIHCDEGNLILIDTGGIGESAPDAMSKNIMAQSDAACEEADLILFLVDAKAGCLPDDQTLAKRLRKKYTKPILLVVNKVDGVGSTELHDFYRLGLGPYIGISASHGGGCQQLTDIILAHLQTLNLWPPQADEDTKEQGIRFAVVGRPNVGKSTLVNCMLGEERVIVSDVAGTTRDSIAIPFTRLDQAYTIIDTAGVRRKLKVTDKIEKFSIVKTLQAIEQSHVVIMVLDAQTGIGEQDLKLLGHVYDQGRAVVLAINKWDGMSNDDKKKVKNEMDRRLTFMEYAETLFISARHGTNVGHLFPALQRAHHSAIRKMTTPKLTDLLAQAVQQHQPPLVRGYRPKLRYAHQGGQLPPCIVIHGTLAESVPLSYQRYLENFFRQKLRLVGTPIRMEFRTTKNPYKK